MCVCSWEGRCLPGPGGVCLPGPGGCLLWGVSALGVSAPRGVFAPRGAWSGAVCLVPGGGIAACTEAEPPPPVDSITDR